MVKLHFDTEMIDPSDFEECAMWEVFSFNSRHIHHKSPEDPDLQIRRDGTSDNPEMQKKLDEGLAFRLGYYEHGQCVWFLAGEGGPGTNCRWDGVRLAGIAVCRFPEELPEEFEKRAQYCRDFLKDYTDWCNGEGYGYSIHEVSTCDECGHQDLAEIESCYGYYGNSVESMFEDIRHYTKGRDVIRVEGDAAHLADYHNVCDKKESTTT